MQVSSDPQSVSAKMKSRTQEADAAQEGSYAANMVAGAVAPDPQAQEADPRVETLRGIIRNRSQQNTPQEAGPVPNSPLGESEEEEDKNSRETEQSAPPPTSAPQTWQRRPAVHSSQPSEAESMASTAERVDVHHLTALWEAAGAPSTFAPMSGAEPVQRQGRWRDGQSPARAEQTATTGATTGALSGRQQEWIHSST